MKPDAELTAAMTDRIDGEAMLDATLEWADINSGTSNLEGLATVAGKLADAFSNLPGEIQLVDPATVTAISAEGHEFEKPHGQHMVLRVRPEAARRVVLTGHMDTVFPADHAFQSLRMAG